MNSKNLQKSKSNLLCRAMLPILVVLLMLGFNPDTFAQETVTTVPAMDGSNTIEICVGGTVTVNITDPETDHEYRLRQSGSSTWQTKYGIIGESLLSFDPITFNQLGTTTWTAQDLDGDEIPFETFTVNVVADPIAPTLTPSPSTGVICPGTGVSADILSGGSDGVGCTDSYEYRINGGGWLEYTPGDVIPDDNTNLSVDIRAVRSNPAGLGCFAENIYEWTYDTKVQNQASGKYYCTIQEAINDATAGNTIIVSDGTYPENLELNTANLILKAENQHAAIIQTQSGFAAGNGYGGITFLADGCTLDGFKIEQNVAQAVIHTHNANSATIKNNLIVGLAGVTPRGIDVGYGSANSDGIIIQNNTFEDLYCGVYVNQATDLSIDDNDFNADMGDGCIVFDGTWNYNLIDVTNNTATNANYLMFFYGSQGAVTHSGNTLSNTELSNWTVVNTSDNIFYPAIQTAIDAAETGGGEEIQVWAGTYNGNVTVSKNISLIGAGSGVTIIEGDDGGSELGAVFIPTGRNGVTIKGFHIKGIDNANPGIEKAAVYLQGTQANITIEDNIIEAKGDAGLQGEWNASNDGITINNNEFTGQTFIGTEPASGDQFTVWNVARQAINFGGGTSTTNTKNFTFTNNTISTVTAVTTTGNTLVTLDLVGTNTISGNTFNGVSSANALRVRGSGTYTIEENSFTGTYPIAISRSGDPLTADHNWFGSDVYADIFPKIQGPVVFVPYSLDDQFTAFGGGPTNLVSLNAVYTDANKDILVEFDVEDGDMELLPAPGLNPTDPDYLTDVAALYAALQNAIETGTSDDIQEAALAIGDEIITEYYYEIDGTKYHLQTAEGNPLVKVKYWQNYLVRDDAVRFPNWPGFPDAEGTEWRTSILQNHNYRTHTNPATGAVDPDWLEPALGRDVKVAVTLIQNGSVVSETYTVPLPAGPVNVYSAEPIGPGTWISSHTSINDAIEASTTDDNYIVVVDAGTYTENVVVNKAVTIEGPQKDIDPRTAASLRTSGSLAEAIVDGGGSSSPVFEITVPGVVINGLEITNGSGDLVSSPDGAPVKTGVVVKYCIVSNSGDEGIQLRNVDGGGVEYCYVYSTTGDGINLSSECTNSYIRYNEVTTSASADAAIYLYGNGPDMLIDNNLISGVTSINGIMVGNKSGADNNKNHLALNNAIVSNNTIIGHTGSKVGVYVNTSRVNIIDNTITNWESAGDAALYLRFDIKDIQVTGNDISGNENGIKVSSGVSAVNALTFLINENNLSGNTNLGITSSSAGAVDATCNWFGTEDAEVIASKISGTVDFLPFLQVDNDYGDVEPWWGNDKYSCIGVGPVVVYDQDPSMSGTQIVSSHMTIQDAIDASTTLNGYFVAASSGNYDELVTINKEITLSGFGSGNTLIEKLSPAANANIVTVAVSNVAIKDIAIVGPAGGSTSRGIHINGTLSNVSIENVISNQHNYGVHVNTLADVTNLTLTNVQLNVNGNGLQIDAEAKVDGLTITDGEMTGNLFGFSAAATFTGYNNSDDLQNVSITGTTFNNNTYFGLLFNKGKDVTLDDITANGNGDIAGSPGSGIYFTWREGTYSNISIVNSTITNNGNNTGAAGGAGILIRPRANATASGITIEGNDISGNGFVGNGSAGIRVLKNNDDTGTDVAGVSINENSITGNENFGVVSTLSGDIDATCNWWGSNSAGDVADEVSGNVNFLPYWISETGPCEGVGPVLVYNGDPGTTGTLVSSHMKIEDAIDASTTDNGYFVIVDAGTYTENVTVNKRLTIKGAGKEQTIIDGNVKLVAPDNATERIVLQDLSVITTTGTIVGDTWYAIWIDAAGGDIAPVTLKNVKARGRVTGSLVYGTGLLISPNGNAIDDLLIEDCEINDNYTHGIFAKNTTSSNTGSLTNFVMKNTSVDNNTVKPSGSGGDRMGMYLVIQKNASPNILVNNVTIEDCSFNGHVYGSGKGIYAEAISNALFKNVTAKGNQREGIDLNLKFRNDYENIVFENCNIYENAVAGGTATYPNLHIKARNDGTTYGANPAQITNLKIKGGTYSSSLETNPAISLGNSISNIDFTNGVTFEGTGGHGLVLYTSTTTPDVDLGNTSFAGTLASYIANASGLNVNATSALFAGKTGETASVSENLAIEDKVFHAMDYAGLGLVTWKSSNVYVTTNTLGINRGIEVVPNSIVNVGPGTFNENVVVDKSVTLLGTNANLACGSRGAESVIAPTAGLPVSVTADDVTINGFEITAPDYQNAIVCGNRSNLTIQYNNIYDIGTSVTGSNVHSINYTVANGVNTSNVKILDNCFNNISSASLTGYSAAAIGVLQSTSTGVLTGLNIERNSINSVNVNTGDWPTGKLAYGIIINVGGGSGYLTTDGKVVNAVIKQNEITNLEGFISTGIGLEGNTEDIEVENNYVANLKGNKVDARAGGGYDLQGLKFENNRYVGTASVANNSFAADTYMHSDANGVGYAVVNYVPVANGEELTLGCNWYGTAVYNEIADNDNLNGRILNKENCTTNFVPYLVSGDDASPSTIGFVPQTGACEGEPVVIEDAVVTHILCDDTDGSILVYFSGGTADYTIDWGISSTTVSNSDDYPISGLPAGTYTITVTDDNGSFDEMTVDVKYLPVTLKDNSLAVKGYYPTIQAAITAAEADDVIEVCAGEYVESGQIVIDKNLTIIGDDKTTTTIKPDADYTASSDGWIKVNSGVTLNLSKVKLDGTGYLIYNGIYFDGNGEINDCLLDNIQYNASGPTYRGTGILVSTSAGNVDIKNSEFTNIGRDGIRHRSTGTVSGNTYTGKGSTGPTENWFDYFILAEYGCDITIDNNTVSLCQGEVTTSSTWGSGAIAIWDDPNTSVVLINNVLTDNTVGIQLQGQYGDGTSLTTEIGGGNVISGGEHGISLNNSGTYVMKPALSFTGTTTLKGQTDDAIWMDENVGTDEVYDISQVVFKDAADNTLTDNYEIEDKVHHALDGLNRGLLTWVDNNVYVTNNTLGIQRGIDAAGASGWTVNIQGSATAYDGNVDATGKDDITLSVGASPACATINGDLTLGSSTTLSVDLDGTVECTEYDKLTVTGTVTLGGAALNLNVGYTPGSGDEFTIIDGSLPIVGQFAANTVTVGGQLFVIDYAGGDGNDVVLKACDGGVVNTNTGMEFCSIQDAIDNPLTLDGHTITVAAGTYAEVLYINKKLDIQGPNYGINPNTGTRVAEAIIKFPASNTSWYMVYIDGDGGGSTVSDVSLNGFTFDGVDSYGGDYPTELIFVAGAENVSINNNVLQNFEQNAIRYYYQYYDGTNWVATWPVGADISDNQILNPDFYTDFNTFGTAPNHGIYLQGVYGTVSGNVVEQVLSGCQIQPYGHPNSTSVTGTVSENTFNGSRNGVWYNNSSNANADWSFSNNTISGITLPSGYTPGADWYGEPTNVWYGFAINGNSYGQVAFTGNTIVKGTTALETHGIRYVHGYAHAPATTIIDNTINNLDYGIYLPANLENVGAIDINSNSISGNSEYGVYNAATTTVDASPNWWGDPTGPNHATNPCGEGNAVSDNVEFDPWYFQETMTTLNGLPELTLSAVDDISTITGTPVVFDIDVNYPGDIASFDPAVLTDASITVGTAFPAGAKVKRVVYNDGTNVQAFALDFALGGETQVYLSEILGSPATPLAGHDGLTVNWEITVDGFEAEDTYAIEIQSVSYLDNNVCVTNLGNVEGFSVTFADVDFVYNNTEECYPNPVEIEWTESYPMVENIGGTRILNDSKWTFYTDAAMIQEFDLPANTNITVGQVDGSGDFIWSKTSVLTVAASSFYGSAIVTEQGDPTIYTNGQLIPLERGPAENEWKAVMSGVQPGTYYVKVENLAMLDADGEQYTSPTGPHGTYTEYVYDEQTIEVVVNEAVEVQISVDGTNPLPALPGTGSTAVCASEAFEMSLLNIVTGDGPLTFVYNVYEGTDNTGSLMTGSPFTVSNVNENGTIYSAAAGDLVAGTYFIETVSITDENGCGVHPDVMAAGYYNHTLIIHELPTAVLSGTTSVCADDNEATLTVDFTGQGPWTFSYTDGTNTYPETAQASPYLITVNPTANTTYNLVGDVTDGNGCLGETSGQAKIYFGPKTTAPKILACPGTLIEVPITVQSFSEVRSISLKLKYDSRVMDFEDAWDSDYITFGSGEVFEINSDEENYKVIIIGKSASGITNFPTIPENEALIKLKFSYRGGNTSLVWMDEYDVDCEYSFRNEELAELEEPFCDGDADLNAEPPELADPDYYANGTVTEDTDLSDYITGLELQKTEDFDGLCLASGLEITDISNTGGMVAIFDEIASMPANFVVLEVAGYELTGNQQADMAGVKAALVALMTADGRVTIGDLDGVTILVPVTYGNTTYAGCEQTATFEVTFDTEIPDAQQAMLDYIAGLDTDLEETFDYAPACISSGMQIADISGTGTMVDLIANLPTTTNVVSIAGYTLTEDDAANMAGIKAALVALMEAETTNNTVGELDGQSITYDVVLSNNLNALCTQTVAYTVTFDTEIPDAQQAMLDYIAGLDTDLEETFDYAP
ncbi:right-handed parallel beta-helix repeat-containing protein, partial [Mariniphaga sp.]|uniref:right-handed parallel beta-helix repeat-containing protein n=1 Tax=Mariniphaga sp. TaxID=1954475 RepID=UPI00356400B2